MENKHLFLTTDDKSLQDGIGTTFSFSTEHIEKILDKIQKNTDSLSCSSIAELVNSRVSDIDQFAGITLYLNHLKLMHNLSREELLKNLEDMGVEKDKVNVYLNKIYSFSDSEQKKLEAFYQATSVAGNDVSITNISFVPLYSHILDENGNFLGISPNVKLTIELTNGTENKKEHIKAIHNLDGLGIVIRTLQEIYSSAIYHANNLKSVSNINLIGIPKDDD